MEPLPDSASAPEISGAELADQALSWPVQSSQLRADGPFIVTVRDQVLVPEVGGSESGAPSTVTRDYVRHPGAVVIVAVDDDDRLILIAQYRHPVRHVLLEPPAGLLDHPDEPPLRAAQRELAEEVGLAAARWSILAEPFSSPGCSDEVLRVFLAEGLSTADQVPGYVAEAEESQLQVYRAPLADVVSAILAGQVHSPSLITGALALAAVRAGLASTRPADQPWPARQVVADAVAAQPVHR